MTCHIIATVLFFRSFFLYVRASLDLSYIYRYLSRYLSRYLCLLYLLASEETTSTPNEPPYPTNNLSSSSSSSSAVPPSADEPSSFPPSISSIDHSPTSRRTKRLVSSIDYLSSEENRDHRPSSIYDSAHAHGDINNINNNYQSNNNNTMYMSSSSSSGTATTRKAKKKSKKLGTNFDSSIAMVSSW